MMRNYIREVVSEEELLAINGGGDDDSIIIKILEGIRDYVASSSGYGDGSVEPARAIYEIVSRSYEEDENPAIGSYRLCTDY